MAYAIFRPKRGTASEWNTANPILAEGELGFEVPDGGVGSGVCKIKIGDGVTVWVNLPYALSPEIYVAGLETSDFITTEQMEEFEAQNSLNINGVSTVAANALTTATEAQVSANEAIGAASTAQQAADNAQVTANTAITNAANANAAAENVKNNYVPKSGATLTGNLIAYSDNRTSISVRNSVVQDNAGTAVATNALYFRRK